TGGAFVVAAEARAGEERLDAPEPAAIARRARTLVVARIRKGVVPPLPGDAVRPREHLAVDDHTAAAPGAYDHAEDDRGARGRAVDRFRQRETVRVVGHADRAIERLLEVLLERFAVQPRGVRVLDESRQGRHGSGYPAAHRGAPTGATFERLDHAPHRGDRAGVVVPGRRHPDASDFAAGVIERDPFDLRAADVDPDPHRI